jgi:hypothetical protein
MDIYWGYEVKFDPGYIFRCKRAHVHFHFKKILKYSPQILSWKYFKRLSRSRLTLLQHNFYPYIFFLAPLPPISDVLDLVSQKWVLCQTNALSIASPLYSKKQHLPHLNFIK